MSKKSEQKKELFTPARMFYDTLFGFKMDVLTDYIKQQGDIFEKQDQEQTSLLNKSYKTQNNNRVRF